MLQLMHYAIHHGISDLSQQTQQVCTDIMIDKGIRWNTMHASMQLIWKHIPQPL